MIILLLSKGVSIKKNIGPQFPSGQNVGLSTLLKHETNIINNGEAKKILSGYFID